MVGYCCQYWGTNQDRETQEKAQIRAPPLASTLGQGSPACSARGGAPQARVETWERVLQYCCQYPYLFITAGALASGIMDSSNNGLASFLISPDLVIVDRRLARACAEPFPTSCPWLP